MSNSSDEDNFLKESSSNETQYTNDSLLPPKSSEKYEVAYDNFIRWKNSTEHESYDENLFLAYFNKLATKYKSSSLWCTYYMLKSTVKSKHGIDIKNYTSLIHFLRSQSATKCKVLSAEDVKKFLEEAPDDQFLVSKVALIFGIAGGCRRQELVNITTKDIVENSDKTLHIKITKTHNNIPRSFTIISEQFCNLVKKYQSLRSKKAHSNRFFQNFQNGKCTCQPIGINKFGIMIKEIAKYLDLPDADSYTGHCFRRTSATLLADSGDITLTEHASTHTWTEDEVFLLIECYRQEGVHLLAQRNNITEALKRVSNKMNAVLLEKNKQPIPLKKASSKMDLLKRLYRKKIQDKKHKNWNETDSWPFFDAMHSIFGKDDTVWLEVDVEPSMLLSSIDDIPQDLETEMVSASTNFEEDNIGSFDEDQTISRRFIKKKTHQGKKTGRNNI